MGRGVDVRRVDVKVEKETNRRTTAMKKQTVFATWGHNSLDPYFFVCLCVHRLERLLWACNNTGTLCLAKSLSVHNPGVSTEVQDASSPQLIPQH